ncbi:hypothetical protein LOK49_LG06G02136 [Camellia lanceoleosa]|uniref:Uncharacterized protein n=1 Tax=Camellia lanceoleosa TaxID=1840588 RepID=A0ACC0HBK3_9ERIC|nr:hypothetical protein LOK49_LG06G02136 [Camellia lanceoleosa]
MLTAIHKGSVELARASHIYSHRHGFRGFAAKRDQASQLAAFHCRHGMAYLSNKVLIPTKSLQQEKILLPYSRYCNGGSDNSSLKLGFEYVEKLDQYPNSSSSSSSNNGGQIEATTGGNHLSLSMSNSQQRLFINPPPLFATAAASSGFPQQITT